MGNSGYVDHKGYLIPEKIAMSLENIPHKRIDGVKRVYTMARDR
jgi:hypothetical protein